MKGEFEGNALPFWKDLSEEERAKISRETTVHRYGKGEHIHQNGECTGVIFIRSGCVRVYLLSDEGRDVTLYRLYAGDVCVLSAPCVLRTIMFDVFVDAEEPSVCYQIGGAAFSQAAEQNLKLKVFACETALDRFSEVMWVMQQILFMKTDRRLAVFLWNEMMRTESELIPLTQEQIAKYMNSAREVVSRVLKYFAGEQIVETGRKGVRILDKERLKQIAYS